MRKKLSIVIAACAAIAVVFAGANTFACGGHTSAKTAALKSGAGCATACCAKSGGAGTATQGTSCHSGTSNAWTSKLCGERGYYAANVYEVRDSRMWAVCCGKKFEVSASTPYTQVSEARYYFADEATKTSCAVQMSKLAAQMDHEAVSLATMDGNVIGEDNGQKIARCIVTGRTFLVTADSPVMVADGKKYYRNDTTDLSSLAGGAQQN